METKLSKILNKLAENDTSIFSTLNSNKISISTISSNLNSVSVSLDSLSARFEKYDYDYLKNQVLGIKEAIYNYTAPNSISEKFDQIIERIHNLEVNGGGSGSGGSSTTAVMKVKSDDPYISVNDNNEIYSLSSNLTNKIKAEIESYDGAVSELSTKFINLRTEIENTIIAGGGSSSIITTGVKIAANDEYIGLNENGEIYSKKENLESMVDDKIDDYDEKHDLKSTIKSF